MRLCSKKVKPNRDHPCRARTAEHGHATTGGTLKILPRGPPVGEHHLYIRDDSKDTRDLYWYRVCMPTCKVNALILGMREMQADLRRLHR